MKHDEVLPIRVFVHLARGFDARDWRRRWESGELVGINEPTPYGYGRAESRVASLTFSQDRPEGSLARLIRLAVRAVLGFDLVHAFANRVAIARSDIIWTHTESQYLAVALLLRSIPREKRPSLLGQSVWLMDTWPRLSGLRRRFLSWLIDGVDVLTFHSPENLEAARRAFPRRRVELVLFGIAADGLRSPRPRTGGSFKILAIGNDRHRDWRTAVAAVDGLDGVELTIISSTASPQVVEGAKNARLRAVRSNQMLSELFSACDLAVVPLGHNLHASGITVLQEAAVMGVPAIASDTGGLRAYFGPDEVSYVPVGDPSALRAAIATLRDDEGRRMALAERAQKRMGSAGLGSHAFVERHLEISRSLAGLDYRTADPC